MFARLMKTINTDIGKIVISIILGLGFASLFRKACDKLNCVKLTAPNITEVENTIYSHGDECYKFKAKTQECSKGIDTINYA